MKLELDRKSWHYRLAADYPPHALKSYDLVNQDICSYTRAVLRGLLFAFGITMVLGFVGSCVASFLAWLIVALQYNMLIEDNGLALIGFMFVSAGIIATILLGIFSWREDRKYAARQKRREYYEAYYKEHGYYPDEAPEAAKKPSFIVEAYKAFKQKYCLRVEFK